MPTALITGANRGIGLTTAEVLAQTGYRLVLTARDSALLQEAVQTSTVLQGLPTEQLHTFSLDVTREEDALAVAAALRKEGLSLDLLVNNAGTAGSTPMDNEDSGPWNTIIQTNVLGVYYVTKALLPLVKDGGCIIALSSVLGRFGVPGYTAYCASKHGVIGFVRALALEVAPRKIRVNAVCPGWVETRMAKQGWEDIARDIKGDLDAAREVAKKMAPLREIIQPREIGELIAFLASDACRNMTGQAITLDAGQVMQ